VSRPGAVAAESMEGPSNMTANRARFQQGAAACLLAAVLSMWPDMASAAESLSLTCRDQASRAPVSGAKVAATVDTTLTYYVTDARGMCAIPLPDGGPRSLITLVFTTDGYVPVVWEWRAGVRPVPAEHTVLLEPGTSIGGVVLHAGEEPVRGATVLVTLPVTESAGNQVLVRDHAVQTGDDGAWRCGIVPAGLTSVYVRVEAPELSVQQNFQYGEGGRPLAPLRDFSDRLVLEERCILYGAVVTPEGQPVAGAAVAVWPTDAPWNSARLAATDGWGRFRVTGCPPRKSTILVRANGWAPMLDYADLLSGVATRELTVERGSPLRVRVVDAAGEPLPGAWIRVEAWRGLEGLLDWQAFADASGEAVWEDAPAEGISLAAEAAGAAPGSVKIPRLKDETYTIRIAAAVRIHGRVLKENDGAPVAAFAVTPGMAARNADGIRWLSSRRFEGADGAFSFTVPRDDEVENFVKITAPGHAPWISPQISSERDEVELTARLASAAPLKRRVTGTDGAPVAGASVYLCTPSDGLYLRNGRVASEFAGPFAETDADGAFELSPERPPFLVVVLSSDGCVLLSSDEAERGGDVTVLPWATLRGNVRLGEAAVRNRAFRMALVFRDSAAPNPLFEYQSRTDDEGHFEIGRLPALECRGVLDFVMEDGSSVQWPTEILALRPGESAQLTVGGGGHVVAGSIPLPEESVAARGPSRMCTMYVQETPSGPDFRGAVFLAGVPVSGDGSFRFPDVPPGQYVASVSLPKPAPADGERTDFGSLEVAFEVPPRETGRPADVIDLGEVGSIVEYALDVGAPVPGFAAHLIDGTPVSLDSYAGKVLLVDVWATWCGPCLGETPFLKKLHDEFGDDERFAMLGVSLDSSKDDLTQYIDREKIPWPQIYCGEVPGLDLPLTWGVDGIPAIFLIGPDGRLLAQHLRGEAIAIAVRQVLRGGGGAENQDTPAPQPSVE